MTNKRVINLAPDIVFADRLTLNEARNAMVDAVNSPASKYYIFSVRTGAAKDGSAELMGRNKELCPLFVLDKKSFIMEVRDNKVLKVVKEVEEVVEGVEKTA
jgi:hypothetical protein